MPGPPLPGEGSTEGELLINVLLNEALSNPDEVPRVMWPCTCLEAIFLHVEHRK